MVCFPLTRGRGRTNLSSLSESQSCQTPGTRATRQRPLRTALANIQDAFSPINLISHAATAAPRLPSPPRARVAYQHHRTIITALAVPMAEVDLQQLKHRLASLGVHISTPPKRTLPSPADRAWTSPRLERCAPPAAVRPGVPGCDSAAATQRHRDTAPPRPCLRPAGAGRRSRSCWTGATEWRWRCRAWRPRPALRWAPAQQTRQARSKGGRRRAPRWPDLGTAGARAAPKLGRKAHRQGLRHAGEAALASSGRRAGRRAEGGRGRGASGAPGAWRLPHLRPPLAPHPHAKTAPPPCRLAGPPPAATSPTSPSGRAPRTRPPSPPRSRPRAAGRQRQGAAGGLARCWPPR
jgi:hypothetical protein